MNNLAFSETLRTLLHRIGRPPKDKGVQIARQLCSGLSTAHAKDSEVAGEGQTIEGGKVLPGWIVNISDLFSRLDRTSEIK